MPSPRPMPPRGSVVIPIRHLAAFYAVKPETWESKLRGYERASRPMGAVYAPMFRALNREIDFPGGGRMVLDIETAEFADTQSNNSIIASSQKALEVFAQKWAVEFVDLIEQFPDGEAGHSPVGFEGHLLKGGFHARVHDHAGQQRLLAYHASKWESLDMRAAHLELLAIIAEERHKMPRESVRLLDFRNGECLSPGTSYKKLRGALLRTADVYLRMFATS